MFGKLMNRYYYGKSGQGDFEKEDLPSNRWQLFGEMLRVRLSALVRLNLMYVLIWIPAMFVIARGLMLWYAGIATISDLAMQLESGAITAEAYAQTATDFSSASQAILWQTLIYLIPCIAITGPFTAGLAYVTRNWARDEHSFIWSDFKDTIKGNWKQGLLVSTITGILPTVAYVCNNFYGEMAAENVIFVVPQVICLVMVAVWMCMLMYVYPQMVTYTLSFSQLLKNSLFLAVARLPMTIGIKLATLLPTLLMVIVSLFTTYFQYALLLWGLYYVVFGYAFHRFIMASYTNGVFDRFINANIEGAQVNRGLSAEEEEDDEDEDFQAPIA